jgi:hypothetical protein
MSRTGNILTAFLTGQVAGRLFNWWQPGLPQVAWGIAIAVAIIFYMALASEPETR